MKKLTLSGYIPFNPKTMHLSNSSKTVTLEQYKKAVVTFDGWSGVLSDEMKKKVETIIETFERENNLK